MSQVAGSRSIRLTRRRFAIVLGIAVLALVVVIAGQWRGDAPVPPGVTHVEEARQVARIKTTLVLLPLRFVEARCRAAADVTVFVFEPTVPFFGGLRAYAVADFPPASCSGDCVGTIGGLTEAEYAEMTTGSAGFTPCA